MLSVQQSLALACRLPVERDAFLHRWVAEGVGAPAELPAGFWVVVRESRRGAWRGVTRRLLILLKRTERDREERCQHILYSNELFYFTSRSKHG